MSGGILKTHFDVWSKCVYGDEDAAAEPKK